MVFVACLFAALEIGRGFGEIGVDTLVVSKIGPGSLPYLFIGLGAIGVRPGEARTIALVALLFASLEAGRGFGEIGRIAATRRARLTPTRPRDGFDWLPLDRNRRNGGHYADVIDRTPRPRGLPPEDMRTWPR